MNSKSTDPEPSGRWIRAINITLGTLLSMAVVICVAFLAWMASIIGEMGRTVTSMKECLPREYVSKNDYVRDLTRLEGYLERIEKKVDNHVLANVKTNERAMQ